MLPIPRRVPPPPLETSVETLFSLSVVSREQTMNEQVTKTEARQGTGPRQMVSVLFASMALAVLAGAVLLWYFYFAIGAAP